MEFFKTENVVKKFHNHVALDDVSIDVPEGQIFGLLGPNGAGKTTLIRIINQITAPDSGKVIFRGRPIKSTDIQHIGYLPEERGLYKKMKVGEQAIYLGRLKGLSKTDVLKKLKYWFEKFEMQAWWDKKVEELSKGMQQKVQFVTTIIHEPTLLIFDEPFSGFDPINANLLKKEILELKQKGATIIFSTHNMGSVEELCDHIALINQSKKILDGQIDQIKDTYKSNKFSIDYMGEVENMEQIIGSSAEILEHNKNKKMNHLTVQLMNGNPNIILNQLTPHVQVFGFNEIVPSMNDVFIKVVEETNQKNKTIKS